LESIPRVRDEVLRLNQRGGSEGPACAAGALIDDPVNGAQATGVGRGFSPVKSAVSLVETIVIASARAAIIGTHAVALVSGNLGEALLRRSRGWQEEE